MSEEKKIEGAQKAAIDAQDAQKILMIFRTYCKGIDYNDMGIFVEQTNKLQAIIQGAGEEAVEAIKQEAIDDYLAGQKAEGGLDDNTQKAIQAAREKAGQGKAWSPSDEQQKGMDDALAADEEKASGRGKKGGRK